MKRTNIYRLLFVLALLPFFIMSCDDDNDEVTVTDPDPSNFDVELAGDDGEEISDNSESINTSKETIKARVTFVSDGPNQRRLYILRNVAGAGDVPYTPSENVDTKGDGSVDLGSGEKDTVDFQFDLPIRNASLTNGTVVYTFWTTSGKGDFRDATKRQVTGGTITVRIGSGQNPATALKSIEDIKLFAPAQNGSTKTFTSLLNEKIFRIDEGNEFVFQWDLGYYYGATGLASLASPAGYPSSVVNIRQVASVEDGESLNTGFFKLSTTFDKDAFDAADENGDLDNVSVPSNDDSRRITQLDEGDVVEFVDNYNNKGLIYVKEIDPGNTPSDFIVIDIKLQN